MHAQVHAGVGTHPKAHAARSYSIRLRGCVPPSSVTVNGAAVASVPYETVTDKIGVNTWHFDGDDVSTVISLYSALPVDGDVVVEVALPQGLQVRCLRVPSILPALLTPG